MKDVNKMILIGRLGADPAQRETKSGFPVVHFPVATTRRVLPEGAEPGAEKQEETQWHRVVAWGRQAEACSEFLKKGHTVYVEGALKSHKYEGKDGAQRTAFEVHADSISFLGKLQRLPLSAAKAAEQGQTAADPGAAEARPGEKRKLKATA